MASEHSISSHYSTVCRLSELRASGEVAMFLYAGQVMLGFYRWQVGGKRGHGVGKTALKPSLKDIAQSTPLTP